MILSEVNKNLGLWCIETLSTTLYTGKYQLRFGTAFQPAQDQFGSKIDIQQKLFSSFIIFYAISYCSLSKDRVGKFALLSFKIKK